MAERDEPIAQLATRSPKELHRRLKLHCVTHEIAVQDFVVEAIEEKLGRKARPKKGTAYEAEPQCQRAGRTVSRSRAAGWLSRMTKRSPLLSRAGECDRPIRLVYA